jgi:hypothetical protein
MATDSDNLSSHVTPPTVPGRVRSFNMPINLKQLAAEQGVRPLQKIEDLRADFWPEDETADQLIAAVRNWRREAPDRMVD